jgi:hypothetical protein
MYSVADLLSGRVHNSLVSLKRRIEKQEINMTTNEQIIHNAAQSIRDTGKRINDGIDKLMARIDALEGVNREDLSDELAELTSAAQSLENIGGRLTPQDGTSDGFATAAQPIVHGDNVPTPLAGESGATDAGAPAAIPTPGVPMTDQPTTPLAENATEDAGITPTGPANGGEGGDGTTDPDDAAPSDVDVVPDNQITGDDTQPVGGPATGSVDPAPPTSTPEEEDDFDA